MSGALGPRRLHKKYGMALPEGAIFVGRPSRWGNEFTAGGDHAKAVEYFEDLLRRAPLDEYGRSVIEVIRQALAGRDLACWCPPDEPCHADTLLRIANSENADV